MSSQRDKQKRIISKSEYEKAKAALEYNQRQFAKEMRGRLVASAKAQKLITEMDSLLSLIKAYKQQEQEQLNLRNISFDRIREIIAIPIIADVLNDLVTGVNATLRMNGCAETIFAEKSNKLRKLSLEIVDTLASADESLPRLIDHDDTLVDAIRKKVFSYIDQRLKS